MNDRGHAAAEFALATGVLLLPVALVVLSFGPWLENRVAAEAAAAEAVRSAVLDLDVDGASAVALDTADVSVDRLRLGWCGARPDVSPAGDCGFGRGSVVELEVQIWTPLFDTPWGEVGGLWVSGHHAEPVDLYRSLG